ncbi:hypothetical protein MXD81_58740 [Microbacteriaceae bacterium K1510]|nr:hypothetical protein [Microbacteriaceae bacterium K1510]
MIRQSIIAATTALVLAGSASAQQIVIQPRAGSAETKGEVRVQVNMNFFVPGPTNDSDASVQAQEKARRVLYDRAAHECELLKSTLASECRLESINVNVNRNYGGMQTEGFNANGNFTFKVTLK